MTATLPGGMPAELRRDPLWGRKPLARGGFNTVQLNAAGWAALAGAGVILGALLALVTPVPLAPAFPLGILLVWGVLLVADHVRWRNGTVGMGFGGLDADAGAAIVAELERRGIAATYDEREYVYDDATPDVQRSILCRNADAEKARNVALEILSAKT